MAHRTFKLSLHDGSFFRAGSSTGIYFERILGHSLGKVWGVLTEPVSVGRWLAPAVIHQGKGGSISLQLTGGSMRGIITEWQEHVLLEYVWHNGSTVRWELSARGKDRTLLVFTLKQVAYRQLIDSAKGWHYHLDLLSLELDGAAMPFNPVESWDEISREAAVRYQAMVY